MDGNTRVQEHALLDAGKKDNPLIKINLAEGSIELNTDKVLQDVYQFGRKFAYENPDVCIMAGILLGGRGLYSTAKFVRQIKNETAFFSRLFKPSQTPAAKPPDFAEVLKNLKNPNSSIR
jgi:hypothetical protein